MAGRLIKFDAFELDCDRYQLRRDGDGLKLEKLPMDLLILLATKDGSLVTRTEIVESLWGKDVFVDSEHGINTAIRKIRQALRDDPETPRFVETVHGRGYRFIASVTKIDELPATAPKAKGEVGAVAPLAMPLPRQAETAPPVPDRPFHSQQDGKRNRALWLWFFAGLLIAAVAALTIIARARSAVRSAAAASIHSLAVLPLENLSGDPSQDYFADGMTDELITMLAKNSTLRVISRTSVMQYKGVHRPLPEIARALGVDGILEGSVTRSNDTIHMNMQLIQAPSDTHLWAESYDRRAKDAAALPRDAALTIAGRLSRAVQGTRAVHSVKPEAYEAYFKGRYYWFAQNGEKSVEYFKKATELQPDYAQAWSGLSAGYTISAVGQDGPPSYYAPLAEQAARRAIELDDSLGDAHNAMQGVQLLFHWNPTEALKESDRAIALDPHYGDGYFLRALTLESLNRMDEAMEAQRKAAELDPWGRPFSMPQMFFRMRNYDAAIREAQVRLGAQPNDYGLHEGLAEAYQSKGLEQEAARESIEAARLSGDPAGAVAMKRAYDRGGYRAVLEWRLNDLKERAAHHQYVSPFEFAWAYVNLRRKDEALHYAEEAYREHVPNLVWMQNWPEWDFLHSDQRYQSIVRKMGLPPAW